MKRRTSNDVVTALLPTANGVSPQQADYARRFIELLPETAADVISYQSNPACGCRGRILTIVNANVIKLNENAERLFGEPTVILAPRSMVGEVHTLTFIAEYTALVQEAARVGHTYRGVTVTVVNDKLLVFFY